MSDAEHPRGEGGDQQADRGSTSSSQGADRAKPAGKPRVATDAAAHDSGSLAPEGSGKPTSKGGLGSLRRFPLGGWVRALRAGRPRRTAIAAGVVLAVCIVLALVFFVTPLCGARTISVRGARTVSADQIRQAAKIDHGAPLARLNTAAVAARIKKSVPAIALARVERQWPSTVTIRVIERVAVATAAMPNGTFALIDKHGAPYNPTATRPAELPLVEVARVAKTDKATAAVATVAHALNAELKQRLVKITAEKPDRVVLILSGGKTVFWGDAWDDGENVRKAEVARALLDRKGSYLDVSSPGIVTVR